MEGEAIVHWPENSFVLEGRVGIRREERERLNAKELKKFIKTVCKQLENKLIDACIRENKKHD